VNGPGSEIRDNYSSMLEKNSPDSPWLMFYPLRVDALLDLTDVSRRMAQMTRFIKLNVLRKSPKNRQNREKSRFFPKKSLKKSVDFLAIF
jgi:hypothetical protein